MIIRTQGHMTLHEAHPCHGMEIGGLEQLDRGGNARVWPKYEQACSLCREAVQRRECIVCGGDRCEGTACFACTEPERYDDHVCGFVCDDCRQEVE